MQVKIVQRRNPAHNRSQRRRDLRITRVRVMQFPLHLVAVDRRVKRLPHLPRRPRKLDQVPPRTRSLHFKSMGLKPSRHYRDVRISRTPPSPKLRRRQPLVKRRRVAVVQRLDRPSPAQAPVPDSASAPAASAPLEKNPAPPPGPQPSSPVAACSRLRSPVPTR